MQTNQNDILLAHKFSIRHKTKLIHDEVCGCFHCKRIFPPSEITEWINDTEDQTALCPYCGIDSIIGKSSGYPVEEEFLEAMKKYWF